jgi:hypothetical protein
MDVPARLAAVARSTDGHGLGLYSLVGAALPEASSGAGAWKDALNRNERLEEADRREVPETYMGKVEGNRKTTHIVRFELAPSVVSFVLKDPLGEFFQNDEARETLAELAGRAPTEAVATSLVAAAAELAERAQQLCPLPALAAGSAVPTQLRTTTRTGQLLGSVRNFVSWLGLDETHAWSNWLEAAFLAELKAVTLSCAEGNCGGIRDQIRDQIREPVLEHIVLPGARLATPMTNYAGFCLILRLCAGRSAISDAMIDEATNTLGRLKVGDQTLHGEIDQNAASASAAERAFVLGPAAAAQQPTPIFDLNAALMEAAKHPETQALMNAYWNRTLAVEAEAEAIAAEAKARIVAVTQEQKTKTCEENNKRQVISATSRADVAEARCREAEAKRRIAELGPPSQSRAERPMRRQRVEDLDQEQNTINETQEQHLDRPLRTTWHVTSRSSSARRATPRRA